MAMGAVNLDQTEPNLTALTKMVEFSGVGLFETTLSGEIRFGNDHLARMLGFTDSAALAADGRSAGSFYVDSRDQARVRREIEAKGRVDAAVYQLRRTDGRLIWVCERGTALRDDMGAPYGYVGSLTDVTNLVETQMQLAQTEADYRRIYECATEGIYRSSLDGRMLRANPALCRLNGYPTEAELMEGVRDIAKEWYVEPNRRAEFKRLLEENGQVENFESEIYAHKSRRRLWISENAYLVRDADGRPLFYEGTVRDITDRKNAERAMRDGLAEAESANRAKSAFLASISHELRTPLNAILGFSELVMDLTKCDAALAQVYGYVEHIKDSGDHLLALINDILDLARIEAGARSLETETLNASALIAKAIATVQPLAQEKGLTLLMSDCGALRLAADGRAMHQCLLNVLSNAIKFSRRDQEIRVSCARQDGLVGITVADRGLGMEPALVARIGQPFLTGTKRQTTDVPGTGLGLAITHSLLEQMGGHLDIVSEPDQGTTAILLIPEAV
ncbi:MAG: PAS domain-containing sensor histidine kinase [Rhodospirillaceae bacterium]|nr:PAS domain-containing sensor histidine kinase [Rhodospirillaceae bacterium]